MFNGVLPAIKNDNYQGVLATPVHFSISLKITQVLKKYIFCRQFIVNDFVARHVKLIKHYFET